MAYSVAALSYLIQNSRKPIVFTGSQKSIYEKDTDARNNLLNAFIYAADDRACGVHLVFDDRVILGTRARKTRDVYKRQVLHRQSRKDIYKSILNGVTARFPLSPPYIQTGEDDIPFHHRKDRRCV